jgi:hypothetical protein
MLYSEITAVCSQIHTKTHKHTLRTMQSSLMLLHVVHIVTAGQLPEKGPCTPVSSIVTDNGLVMVNLCVLTAAREQYHGVTLNNTSR